MKIQRRTEHVHKLLEQVFEAHGGLERWQKVNTLSVSMTVGGLVFRIKGRQHGIGKPFRAEVFTKEQKTHITPFSNKAGTTGIFTPKHLWIKNDQGEVLSEMRDPASKYHGVLKSLLLWDDLGQLYFGGYAISNYYNLPFTLANEDITLEEIPPKKVEGELCQGLRARYPDGFASHSKIEKFYFNPRGWLVRHDYKAKVVGPYAYASHFSMDYFSVEGFILARRRRVYSNFFGIPLKPMSILYMDIHGGEIKFF